LNGPLLLYKTLILCFTSVHYLAYSFSWGTGTLLPQPRWYAIIAAVRTRADITWGADMPNIVPRGSSRQKSITYRSAEYKAR